MATSTRVVRNAAILAKIESTTGTDATPVGADDAVLFADLSITVLSAQNVDRDLIRPYLGASEMLIGPRSVQLSFSVEFVGSGTVATAPAWAPLVRGCGLAETLTATVRADYTPISSAFETLTIYYNDGGVLHKMLASIGNVEVSLMAGEIPRLRFTFVGLDGTISAASVPTVTLTDWQQPEVVQRSASGSLTIGATHSTTLAPAFTSGTAYPSMGLSVDLANEVVFNPFLTTEKVDLTQRKPKGRIEIVASAAQEVALIDDVKAGTLRSIGLLHGSVTNNKVGIWLPSCQLMNPSKGDRNGVRTMNLEFMALPASGNDEVRLIASYA